jgi:hypothetical protein
MTNIALGKAILVREKFLNKKITEPMINLTENKSYLMPLFPSNFVTMK